MCREEGRALANLHASGKLGSASLIGVIKEVAPVSKAPTDKELGVKSFHDNYFPFDLYRNRELNFYSYLGNRSIFSQIPANPLKWFSGYKSMMARMKQNNIKGNMAGEGITLGGVLVVSESKGIVYSYQEETNSPIPEEQIIAAVRSLEE